MKKNIAIFLSFIFLASQTAKADVSVGFTGALHMFDVQELRQQDKVERKTMEVTLIKY